VKDLTGFLVVKRRKWHKNGMDSGSELIVTTKAHKGDSQRDAKVLHKEIMME